MLRVSLMCSLLALYPAALVAADAEKAPEILKVGSTFPKFEAKDQHDKPYAFQKGTRFVLISFDMSTGKKANKKLEEKGAEFLGQKKAVFISNIHGMPGIGRVFALPKMRRYPHRIILADAEHLLDPFPTEKDRVTLLTLDPEAKITQIAYWDPEKQELSDVLK